MKKLLTFLLSVTIILSSLTAVYAQNTPSYKNAEIRGVDISSYFSLINSGVEFFDFDGTKLTTDGFFDLLSNNSINYIRVRVWNNPYDSKGNSYGGGACDLDNAIKIGNLAASHNMKLFVDFHLSDFWTDPSAQRAPKAWQNFELSQKQSAVYDFVHNSLKTLSDSGCNVGMVQIGNEINGGMCGETNQTNIASLLKSGFSAVTDVDSSILKAVHYTNPEQKNYEWFAQNLNNCGVDYDVFATSYYSYWHGTTENLTQQMSLIAEKYNKYVLVAEMAYPFTTEDSDFFANNISGFESTLKYPISVDGQTFALRDVFNAITAVGEKGLGVFYWEPAWITVGTESYNSNYQLWEKYGSGWQSSFAAEYCEDGALYHGGSSWDNQALYDKFGNPSSTLKVFNEYNNDASVLGDANLDGKVTITDVTLLQKHLAGIASLSLEQLARCDVIIDGAININDVTQIQKYIVSGKQTTKIRGADSTKTLWIENIEI